MPTHIVGCSTKVKPDGNEQVMHVCPRCHNATVFAANKKTWFELFWIPLVPFSSKHVWMCSICHWAAPAGQGHPEPQIAYNPSYVQPPMHGGGYPPKH
ncbi:hypothetical protein CYLTODRAFT_424497 [Cylindrobasidium torrendii FP15055 ss-10]|uniref:Zinc-ribbon 15 domain-containing protein n=1 Tax=Cylindrobasidium torrendii FP15055 ss-10 TaxID=1314674 RepID=A0A0D7B451_9AGAR|nr:hypothetical protein CYLTODRAFT_424497 [Cylindrobasidium torrendii FP15055 ss-10]